MKHSSAAAAGGNRFERRRERTRGELLAAATRVLAAKGLQATKIADIAAAADVGVGTFYLHFETKEALFDGVVEDAIGRLKTAIDTARAAATDPLTRVRLANAAMCRFAQDNREVFKIVFGPGAAHHERIRQAQAMFAADVEENLREGIASGAFADLPTEITSQAIVGMATQLLAWWTEHGSVALDALEHTINALTLCGLSPAGGGSAHV